MRFERFFGWSVVVAFAAGCELGEDGASNDDTGVIEGPPGADMPAYCEELSREAVLDLDTPPAGFTFAASEALGALTGAFEGEFVTYDADGNVASTAPARLGLEAVSVDAVQFVLVDPADDGTTDGPPMGAPDQATVCALRYEIHATGALAVGDGLLDEALTIDLAVVEATSGSFSVTIGSADVAGSAEPPAELLDDPMWDRIDLAVDAFAEAGAWTGSVAWSAVNEDPVETYEEDPETGTGSGTVEPSGMYATLGTFTVTPAAR